MDSFDKECLETFLEKQTQLLDEPIAETLEEANTFLEDAMAVVCKNIKEVKEYWDENGADTYGMTLEDIKNAQEVFALPSGRFLVVEG